MKKYLSDYLQHMKQRGMSPCTIYSVKQRIEHFYNFLKKNRIRKVTQKALEKYKCDHIDVKKHKFPTIENHFSTVRNYFKYLTARKIYLFNPADCLTVPKRPNFLLRDIPTPQEMQRILDGIDTVGSIGKKRKAILELLYSTGIRAGELMNLDLYDVNFKRYTIFIRGGKGNKDRVVPFGKKAAMALKDYIHNVRKYHAKRTNEKKLFLSSKGTKFTPTQLYPFVRGAWKGRRLQAHSIRHACAIGMLRNGADIRYIQELLGHSDISTTQRYTRVLPTHLQEVHAKYHPRRIKRNALTRQSF